MAPPFNLGQSVAQLRLHSTKIAQCSNVQIAGKRISAATAVSSCGCHIKAGSKLWEAKPGAMGSCNFASGRLPGVGSLSSGPGRLQVVRLRVMIRAVASRNEGQPKRGIASAGAGLEQQMERNKALKELQVRRMGTRQALRAGSSRAACANIRRCWKTLRKRYRQKISDMRCAGHAWRLYGRHPGARSYTTFD
jgi:hypothetical protein